MAFLPALRRKDRPAVLTGQVLPAERTAGPMGRADERKIILQDYYQHLLAAGANIGGRDERRPWNLARAIAEGYSRGVWTFRSVETIAGQSSRLPFRLKDGEQTVEDHPLYRVLNHGKANPMETGRQLRKRVSAQALLSDKGVFVETTPSRAGDIVRLDLLPPMRTSVIPGTGQTLIKHYELRDTQGRIEREIDPARVLWIREPHPTDPYRGVTPLEAAGLSIELDHFARLYNVSFMRNDGRPGGVIAVDGEMDEPDMDRIEARFGRGPVEAGKMSVIQGQVSYIDLAARPRDLQYGQTASNSKVEILVAFGVPESQLGNAADRTFANADEEAEAFWTITMAAHNDLIVSAFDSLSDEGLTGYLDTSSIEALQRAIVARREEARAELDAGAITIDEYREKAGYPVIDLPHTRALYIASGKTPIPTREEDNEALGLATAVEEVPVDPAATAPVEPAPDPAPQPTGAGTPAAPPAPPVAGPAARTAAQVIAAATPEQQPTPAVKALLTSGCSRDVPPGALPTLTLTRKARSAPAEVRENVLDETLVEDVEQAVQEALSALAVAWVERAVARLESPKSRKGTRHWTPEFDVDTRVGTKALDPARAVDPERWASEAGDAVEPLLVEGAEVAAEDMTDDLGWQEVVAAAVAAYLLARGRGDNAASEDVRALPALRRLAWAATYDVMAMVRESARRQARTVMDLIAGRDRSGASIDDIRDDLRAWGVRAGTGWAAGLAAHAAGAALEAARAALAGAVTTVDPDATAGPETAAQPVYDVERMWLTKRDERVRDSHDAADGQRRDVVTPFLVGDSLLRFPGDPVAPVHETANCRCRLLYRSTVTGRFVRDPQRKHLPGKHDQGRHGNRFRSTGPRRRDRELVRQGRARARDVGDAPSVQDGRGRSVQERNVSTEAPEQTAEYRAVLAEIAADFDQPDRDVTAEDLADWRMDWDDEYGSPEEQADALAYAAEDDAFLTGWANEWHSRTWGIADDDTEALNAAMVQWGGAEPEPDAPAPPPAPELPQWLVEESARHEAERAAAGGRRVARARRSPDEIVREDYELYVQAQYLAATEATKGALYSQAGTRQLARQERAGYSGPVLDDYSLFRGRLPKKYASEELLGWFEQNQRLTFTQFRAQALGRDSDVRAARTAGRTETYEPVSTGTPRRAR